MLRNLFFIILLWMATITQAQSIKPTVNNWHYLDYKKDGYYGISLQQAYDLLKGRKRVPVIVAVIDSGIDTLHPDIPLWTNPKEIPGNHKDDDGNGLVDDYYGWNYLGAPDGKNLTISISDDWRTYHRFKKQFENVDNSKIPAGQAWQYREWKRSLLKLKKDSANAALIIENLRRNLQIAHAANEDVKKLLHKDIFTSKEIDSLSAIRGNEPGIQFWESIFKNGVPDNAAFLKDFDNYKKEQEDNLIKLSTPPIEERNHLLQNDGYDISTTHYGNSNLTEASGYHGTSVSSIIGAKRGNNIGIDGIADNVKIMMIRGILGKDEFDKDVALSIRYAVDHGAKVINMSFGKYISPDKKWVDEAIEYALTHDVVIVHAAGNDAVDNDTDDNYPSSYSMNGKYFPNVIQVGASGDASTGGLVAKFSNYGKKTVDVFAPGVDIHCAIIGTGTQTASGTSLASPMVAGIAALLRSYFPKLKATEVVDIIKKSGTTITAFVTKPGTNEQVSLKELCNSGNIVNAANAVKMVMERK